MKVNKLLDLWRWLSTSTLFFSGIFLFLFVLAIPCSGYQERFYARTLSGYTTSNYLSRGNGEIAQGAEISSPQGVFSDSLGNVYITESSFIRRISATDQKISVFAGGGVSPEDDVPATSAPLNDPYGIVGDTSGNIYFSDNGDCCVRKIRTSTQVATILGVCGQCQLTTSKSTQK